MSETTAEYGIKDEFDIQKHIEQECILGSFKRLKPIIENIAQKSSPGEKNSSAYIAKYIELERLALDLARYALDYYEITYKSSDGRKG